MQVAEDRLLLALRLTAANLTRPGHRERRRKAVKVLKPMHALVWEWHLTFRVSACGLDSWLLASQEVKFCGVGWEWEGTKKVGGCLCGVVLVRHEG